MSRSAQHPKRYMRRKVGKILVITFVRDDHARWKCGLEKYCKVVNLLVERAQLVL